LVEKPVGGVEGGKLRGVYENEVLSVVVLGLGREIEGAGENEMGVYDHVLIVEDIVSRVVEDRDVVYGEQAGLAAALVALSGVEDNLDRGTASADGKQGASDCGGGELVGGNDNAATGYCESGNYGRSASALGGKVNGGDVHGVMASGKWQMADYIGFHW